MPPTTEADNLIVTWMEEITLIYKKEEGPIKDVTPMTAKANISTINIVPGITPEEEETPGRPPSYSSRWTIRKSITDIPLTHQCFVGANKKTFKC